MNKKLGKRIQACMMAAVLTAGMLPAAGMTRQADAAENPALSVREEADSAQPVSGGNRAVEVPEPENSDSEASGSQAPDSEIPNAELPAAEAPDTELPGSGTPDFQVPAEPGPAAGPGTAAQTSLSSASVVADTFESGTAGAPPAGWSIGNPPSGVTALIAESAERGGKVLKINQAAPVAAGHNFRRNAAVTTGRSTLAYSFSVDSTNAVIYLPTPSVAEGSMVQFALYGGEISYKKKEVNGWTKLMPVAAGTWYDVRVTMNSSGSTFDLDVDGRRLLTKEPLTRGGPMQSFYLSVYRENAGSASFDDIIVNGYIAASGASFAQAQYEVATGRDIDTSLNFQPADATDRSAVYSSADESIATVDAAGRVHGVSPGTTVITAQPDEPIPAAETTVVVADVPATGITIQPLPGPIPTGSRILLQATIEPEDTTEAELQWSSADESIATVDRYGEVTGVSPGQTTLSVASVNGTAEASVPVTVAARTVMAELFVSPQGSDTNTGTQSAPFATIERAQQEARALNDNMTGDIVVNLGAGTFALDETLNFAPEDSGTNGHFVIYRGAGGEETVISGGSRITGWAETVPGSGIYRAPAGNGLQTRQLFVDGVRAVRARSEGGLNRPNQIATGYTSRDTEIASWSDADELELVFEDVWTNSRVRVQSVTQANGLAQITLREPGWTNVKNRTQTSATLPVYYENAIELLDEPGEWYHDRDAGYLYYMPREWENLADAEVIAPGLEKLAAITGGSADNPVRNLNFENVAFMYSTWMRPSTDAGHSDAQNNHLRYSGTPDQLAPAAVEVELANTVNFTGTTFAKLGITGLRMQNGVQNSRVEGSRFYDLSGGAVNVGQPNSSDRNVYNPEDTRLSMKNNDILNNVIHDIGVDYKSAAAVSAGYPLDMEISHNEMYNLPYSGVHIGYGWNKDFDPVTQNVKIENNLIYDLMGMGLHDGGAIYTLGTTGGTAAEKNLVRGNYIRNQLEANAALYTDEGSAYWKFERNVIDLKDAPPWTSPVRWAMAYVPSIHDVEYVDNYTTTSTYTNNGTGVLFENNTVVPDANWPQEAQAIADKAGLESAYGALNDGEIGRWSVEAAELASGTSEVLAPVKRGSRDEILSAAGAGLFYRSTDPAVATVDAQGEVTGIAQGTAEIEVLIIEGSVLRILKAPVQVDDVLEGIALEGHPGGVAHIRQGQVQQAEPYGTTRFGDREEIGTVSYASANPAIFTVSASGEITGQAVGTATLTLTAALPGGGTLSSDYTIRVWNEQSADVHSLQAEIGDPEGWYVKTQANGLSELENGTLALRAPAGYMAYADRKFQNEMLKFDLRIDDAANSANWYAMMLGSQDITQNYNTGTMYLAITNKDKIELHRFNAGKRTILYGSLDKNNTTPGPAGFGVPNTMLALGQKHTLETGLFREAGGVRIILKSDGQEVFNYLDTSEDAIGEAGHLGFISRQRVTELSD
ncbi:Ig-like domain-containing protein [Saccharibacillus deserti]|uniref:Ig-like domain-containing protein n=1 Tax=Saccharibacillus deserti TaxID=1634444 RepID=UPI001554264D|nr:Ig-like domain-containing protein [Saccharibacillus deserti]